MGKQYKKLTLSDIEFIGQQKVFYIVSCSGKEVKFLKVKDNIILIEW